MSFADLAGPVLGRGLVADVMLAALEDLNPQIAIEDRGAYRRAHAPRLCRLTRRAVEERLGRSIKLSSELEKTMSSYRGRMVLSDDEVRWEAP